MRATMQSMSGLKKGVPSFLAEPYPSTRLGTLHIYRVDPIYCVDLSSIAVVHTRQLDYDFIFFPVPTVQVLTTCDIGLCTVHKSQESHPVQLMYYLQ